MTIKSVAAFFREANGKMCLRVAHDMPTLDTLDAFRDSIKSLLVENGIDADRLVETDTMFEVRGGTNFWLKPVVRSREVGVFDAMQDRYTFSYGETVSRGERKGCSIDDEGRLLVSTLPSGYFTYEIVG